MIDSMHGTGSAADRDVRGAVERMAGHAGSPPLPGAAILRAGGRRRTRRRAGAAGALALAATMAVSVAAYTTSGSRSGTPLPPLSFSDTASNAYTDQLGSLLQELMPGTQVTVKMFTDISPATRYWQYDHYDVEITKDGQTTDAVLDIIKGVDPDFSGGVCVQGVQGQPKGTYTDCTQQRFHGGEAASNQARGQFVWNAPEVAMINNLGQKGPFPVEPGQATLTVVSGMSGYRGVMTRLSLRAGTDGNTSGITSENVTTALADPRFNAFLDSWLAHPDDDPYGPVVPIPLSVVASGSLGADSWSLSYGRYSTDTTMDGTGPMTDCNDWVASVDGRVDPNSPQYTGCGPGPALESTSPKRAPSPAPVHHVNADGTDGALIGALLYGNVPTGTVSVTVSFDDGSPKVTGKAFTPPGGYPSFAVAKAETSETDPGWKLATVKALDASGKTIGEFYFAPPRKAP